MSKKASFSQDTPNETAFDVSRVGAFVHFVNVAEKIKATTKRLEKAALLGSYFTTLSDHDLAYAARYFAGYIFPLRDQRTINIGGAALLTAIAVVSGEERSVIQEKLVKLGDPGDVVAEVFSNNSLDHQPIKLQELSAKLEQLAAATGTKRKTQQVIDLLQMATKLEAKYIVKLLAGDLRIGLKEGAVEDTLARMFNTDVSKVQWANMLTGDIGETAIFARHQKLEQVRMRLFHPIKFMLASPANDLTDVAKQMPSGFAVEDKYDGIRAQVHIAPLESDNEPLHGTVYDNKRIALFSRTLDEITLSFPDLVQPLADVIVANSDIKKDKSLILDGEIVPIQGDRILPFQELQKRLGRKKVSPELLSAVPVAFIAYDVLYAKGQVLINEPFTTRRSILESLHLDTATVRCAESKHLPDSQLDAEFVAARARGNEGLMVKALNSSYKPGRRGREWLKIKRALATLDVVITAAEVGSGKRHRFLSDYTFAVRKSETDPTLLNVGKAYSGLTDAEISQLSNWCRAHTLQELEHGRVCLVEPQIVLEVTFDRVQVSQRHKSGYALRFPRILRLRHDKPVSEIDTLNTVRSLAQTPDQPVAESESFVDTAANTFPTTEFNSAVEFRSEDNINSTPTLAAARKAFRTFIEHIERSKSVVVLHDCDADGVTAGVVLQLALERCGFEKVTLVIPDRDRNAWTPANRERVQASLPDYLFVLDLGSQPEPIISGVPACFIDHHRPEGVGLGDTLISAYSWEPIPNTSLLVWEVCQEIAEVSDLDWIAAIGTIGDLGEKAPFEMLANAKSKYTAKYLKEASALVNAARRASSYQPEIAAKAILASSDPRSLVNSTTAEVEYLHSARTEVNAALQEAKKAAPVFSGDVALVRVNSPCQIHPLIAQSWRTRLPKYIVIVANEGYIRDRVNFSVRTASGTNVLDFLRSLDLSASAGSYGHGHDSASGGSLPFQQWNQLLVKIGFELKQV